MKKISLLALAVSCGFGMQVHAQEIGRYDKKVEQAMLKKAAEKIGPLRGLIMSDDANNFVTLGDLQTIPKKESSLTISPQQVDPVAITMAFGVDNVVTGRSYKFDSDGNPMNNHQDYPRPTPASVAKSLFEAMQLNPYPYSE